MATTVNSYPADKADGNPLSAAEVNTLSDGSENHHVNLCELFGPGVIGATDWNLGIVAGQIALTITAGQGIVGDTGERAVRITESAVTIDSDQGLAAGAPTTYYVFKKRDPTDSADDATGFVAQTSATAPADTIPIGSASMGATEAASVDSTSNGRINLRNPVVLSGLAAKRPTFGTVGRFWFSTDTAGGTLYFDTGAAWQQVAQGATEAHALDGAFHTLAGSTEGHVLVANSATTFSLQAPGTRILRAGVHGSRPAATAVPAGTYYLSTDQNGGTTYRSDGAAWVQIGASVNSDIAAIASQANGDLITRAAGVYARLGIGSDRQRLTVVSGAPAWADRARHRDTYKAAGQYYRGGMPSNSAVTTTGIVVVDTFYAVPLVFGKGYTLDRLAFRVTTGGGAGAVIRAGIYSNLSEAAPYPNALLVDGGEYDGTAVASNITTISQAIADDTLVWLVLLAGVDAPTIQRLSASVVFPLLGATGTDATQNSGYFVAQAYGALPGTYPAGGTIMASNNMPSIGVRIA